MGLGHKLNMGFGIEILKFDSARQNGTECQEHHDKSLLKWVLYNNVTNQEKWIFFQNFIFWTIMWLSKIAFLDQFHCWYSPD